MNTWNCLGSPVSVDNSTYRFSVTHKGQIHPQNTEHIHRNMRDVTFNNCFLCEQSEEAFQYLTLHCLYFLSNLSRPAFHLYLKYICICIRYCSDALWMCVIMTSTSLSSPVMRAGLPGNHSWENGKSSPVTI